MPRPVPSSSRARPTSPASRCSPTVRTWTAGPRRTSAAASSATARSPRSRTWSQPSPGDPDRLAAVMDTRTGLPVVGMVGGGQLARMTHQAAIALGQSLRVLAVSPDDGAALVAADVQLGRHDDLDALRKFATGCDVVTFDHEHVPGDLIRTLAAEGVT